MDARNSDVVDAVRIRQELGTEADLVMAPDNWLENQQRSLQARMSMLADELYSVTVARRLKDHLQRNGLMAICVTEGCTTAIVVCETEKHRPSQLPYDLLFSGN